MSPAKPMNPAKPVGRFAPTPSGRLHPGNLLCALLAWLSVRSRGGTFWVRIEDVDIPRCPRSLAEQCLRDLEWLGLDWDGTPVYQSDRGELYEAALEKLRAQGLVYPCFCTRAQLMAVRAPNQGDTQVVYPGTCARLTPEEAAQRLLKRPAADRVRVPDEEIMFTDRLQGLCRENPARDCGDFVVRRSDGLWGYQLAVVEDDRLQGVTEVVRGRDILTSTPRQIFLQRALGAPEPEYVHIPLLTDADGRRLAKRDRDIDVTALSGRMTSREAVGLLACAAGLLDRPEACTPGELLPLFSWDKVPKDTLTAPAALRDQRD